MTTEPVPPPSGHWRVLLTPETTPAQLEALLEELVADSLSSLARQLTADADFTLPQRCALLVKAADLMRPVIRGELTAALTQLRH